MGSTEQALFYAPYADAIGQLGVASFLVAYFLLQKGRLAHDSMPYLLMNLVGALLVIASLLVSWNLPSFMLEAAWAMISIYGIYRSLAKRRNAR